MDGALDEKRILGTDGKCDCDGTVDCDGIDATYPACDVCNLIPCTLFGT